MDLVWECAVTRKLVWLPEISGFLLRVGSNLGYLRKLQVYNCRHIFFREVHPFSGSIGLHTKSDLQKSDKKDRNFGYPTRHSVNRTPLELNIKIFQPSCPYRARSTK